MFTYEQVKRMRKQVKIEFDDKISTWKYESFLKLYKEFITLVIPEKQRIIDGSYHKYLKDQENLEKVHRTGLR